MVKIYLDNCCYNRPFDDRSNIRNYLEREAVLLIMEKAFEGELEVMGSDILVKEMQMISDPDKREDVERIYKAVHKREIPFDEGIIQRAKEVMKQSNIKAFDSLHLASAEAAHAVLITTDLKFLKACKRLQTYVEVKNPIEFILEVIDDDSNN